MKDLLKRIITRDLLKGNCKVSINKKRPAISEIWHHNASFRISENLIKIEYEPNKIEAKNNVPKEKKEYIIHFSNIKKIKTGGNTLGALFFLTALQPYITIHHKDDEYICLHGTLFKGLREKIVRILETKIKSL